MLLRSAAALLCLLARPAVLGAQQPAPAREPWRGWDAYVEKALAAWQVPGAGVAIVRNDSVVYARGFGVRETGKPERVDANTIFAIGSSSKAFTAAAVAMLADDRKLSLDDNATRYLPSLRLADPYASAELTVRDLLSHRSGLARGELVWYNSPYDRDEVIRRVRFLQPSWSFRSRFGYQNIMYIAAGQVVAGVSGKSWDEFIDERIFGPLGMTASSTTIRGIERQANRASPHALVDEQLRAVPWRNIDNAGAAGSINSSATEMAQWLRLQLGRGTYAGKRLISERMIDEMWTPHTVVPIDTGSRRANPYTHLQAYGLGWFVQDYRGELVVQHGGNVDGMTALVGMMPDRKLGIVVLTNMNGTGLPGALMQRAFDLHLGASPEDWSAKMLARTEAARARAREAQRKAEAARVPNTKPTLPLEKYAGVYVDSLMGELSVRDSAGALVLTFGNWSGRLEHWHYDTFRTRFDTPVLPAVPVHFRLNPRGEVEDVQIDMAGVSTFRRRPAPPAGAPTPATPTRTP